MTIRNPIEWGMDQLRHANVAAESAGDSVGRIAEELHRPIPEIRHIGLGDLSDALSRGLADFAAHRSDVVALCVIYPLAGLLFGRFAFGYDMLPLVFPLVSGFALVGPFAAIGLYEMSRRRERGETAGLADAFGVVRNPGFPAVVVLGLVVMLIFLLWLGAAETIYAYTLGVGDDVPPPTPGQFISDVFTTDAGWALIAIGVGVGFLFAVVALSIGVVSFPLLLDRRVGIDTAVWTSVRAVAANPGPMAVWGFIVAAGLVVGSLPLLLGLAIVMPVLGHATWHLYRNLVR
jgi:uncharacterized membrane protein